MINPFDYHAPTLIRDLKQFPTVDYYYSYFDLLWRLILCHVSEICDAYFLSRFICGFKIENQAYALQFHPTNVPDAYELVQGRLKGDAT